MGYTLCHGASAIRLFGKINTRLHGFIRNLYSTVTRLAFCRREKQTRYYWTQTRRTHTQACETVGHTQNVPSSSRILWRTDWHKKHIVENVSHIIHGASRLNYYCKTRKIQLKSRGLSSAKLVWFNVYND